jgi:hypothetical protein
VDKPRKWIVRLMQGQADRKPELAVGQGIDARWVPSIIEIDTLDLDVRMRRAEHFVYQ